MPFFSSYKKIPTSYDAKKQFKKNIKVYSFFRAKDSSLNDGIYYLFNNAFEFDKNVWILEQRFKDIEGYVTYYTDNEKYPLQLEESSFHQLVFPL